MNRVPGFGGTAQSEQCSEGFGVPHTPSFLENSDFGERDERQSYSHILAPTGTAFAMWSTCGRSVTEKRNCVGPHSRLFWSNGVTPS